MTSVSLDYRRISLFDSLALGLNTLTNTLLHKLFRNLDRVIELVSLNYAWVVHLLCIHAKPQACAIRSLQLINSFRFNAAPWTCRLLSDLSWRLKLYDPLQVIILHRLMNISLSIHFVQLVQLDLSLSILVWRYEHSVARSKSLIAICLLRSLFRGIHNSLHALSLFA